MAIIMRSGGQKRDQGDKRKQIYTWVGCGLVAVLTLVSVIPNMGSEPKAPDYSKFSSSKMADLAAMPFGTDAETGSFLRDNQEYGEVASNADLLNSLFSAEDRKERHEKDVSEGVPPPPDPEYREIARDKERVEENKRIESERKQRITRDRKRIEAERKRIQQGGKKTPTGKVRNTTNQTKPGNLTPSAGKNSFGGGGGTSVGVTWNYTGKDIKTGQGNTMPTGHNLNVKDVNFVKGRSADLHRAIVESKKGENALSAESAATGAMDAFGKDIAAEDLEKDENELDLGDELPTIDPNLQDELKRAINDDVDDKISNTPKSSDTSKGNKCGLQDSCMNSCTGKFQWKGCFWPKFWENLLNKSIDCVTSGCWTNWGSIGSAKSSGGGAPIVDNVTYGIPDNMV